MVRRLVLKTNSFVLANQPTVHSGVGLVAVAVGDVVAASLVMAVDFVGFGATIHTHQEIQLCPV